MSNRFFICASAVLLLIAVIAHGPGSSASAAEVEHMDAEHQAVHSYRVTGFAGRYVHDLPNLPRLSEAFDRLEIELSLLDGVYVAREMGDEPVTLRLADVSADAPVQLGESALPAIALALAATVSDWLPGDSRGRPVFVAVDPRDVEPITGRDIRTGARRDGVLRFRVEFTGDPTLIDRFTPRYLQSVEDDPRPTIEQLLTGVRVNLVRTDAGYVAWRPAGTPGTEPVTISLAEIAERPTEPYTEAALQEVAIAMRDYLAADKPGRRLMGIVVRPEVVGREVMLNIITGEVDEIRSLAAGDRLSVTGPDRVDHRAHSRIRQRSPVQPGEFLDKRAVDDYVFMLQRHPGRRVDVALAPGEELNTVNVDYLITENRPLLLYGQASNTGTAQTGRWRFRFGLMHSQLTGNDDILSLDYNTAEFTRTHAFSGSYEARVFDADRLRWRVHGLWSEFQASDVGIPFLDFDGETWQVGAELIWNAFQDRQLFVDVVGGARFMHASVENIFAPPGIVFIISEASKDFVIPYAGLRLDRTDERASIRGSVMFEGSIGEFTGIRRGDLSGLGRPFPDKDWFMMQWDLGKSFFLEPLINPEGWADPTTPETSTLAHEVMLGFKGQHAFGNRLIPQLTMTAGGMFSVRGYPESVVSGDTVLIGTAEYRFHLPRSAWFGLQPEPGEVLGQPFRWAPQHVYGRPDWNLVLRGFVDAARTMHSDRLAFEVDNTLVGAGVGLEVSFRRNLNLRVDWGFALRSVEDSIGQRLVNSGSNRVHFAATILY